MSSDAVDGFLRQWARERPDLDVFPMGVIGRLHRAYRLVSGEVQNYFHSVGMESWEFDVLATLRRSGPPYTLSPKDLVATTMVGSPALTNRVDHLVRQELVTREVDPNNRRRLLITLTEKGLELVDRVVEGHLANERRLLVALDAEECHELNTLLRKLLVSLGDAGTVSESAAPSRRLPSEVE
ncbi:MAG TPA: MarR family transcriptional regulator [Micromonospora sp.]|nr:MarR family transcriptional regulator [Micromonospora sp.]